MGGQSYWPLSNVHSAPPPDFFMISFGSIVHSNFEMLSTIEPAAPSDEAPAVKPVALTSFASRPVKVRLRIPKVRSQVRAVMSTLLVLQTTEFAMTEIFVLGVKPKLVMPPTRRAISYQRHGPTGNAGPPQRLTPARQAPFRGGDGQP